MSGESILSSGKDQHKQLRAKELVSGSLFLTSGNLLQAAFAFAVNLVLVRYIAPNQFGWFALILAETSLVYAIISIRANTLIIRAPETAFDDDAKDLYFSVAIYETLIASVIALGVLGVIGNFGIWEVLIAVSIAGRHWTEINKAFFERSMPYKPLAIIETASSMIGHVSALVLVLMGAGVAALVVREVVITVTGLIGLKLVGGLTTRKFRVISMVDARHLLRDCRGVWLDNFLQGTFQRFSIMIAAYFGGHTIAGYFFQAQRFATIPHQVLNPFITRVMVNWFSRVEDTTHRRRVRDKLLWLMIGLLIFVALFFAYVAGDLIPWLLGEEWTPVAPMLVWMSGFIVFASPFEILRGYGVATHQMAQVNIARLMQHLVLFLPIMSASFGIFNINNVLAVMLSLSYGVGFVVMLYALRRNEST